MQTFKKMFLLSRISDCTVYCKAVLEVCLGCCGKDHSRVGTERVTDAVEVNEYFLEEMTPKWISERRVGVKQ